MDDRIRAIANGLGLRTILWKYDSFDWQAGIGGVTEADVDTHYEALISQAESGTFDNVRDFWTVHAFSNIALHFYFTARRYYVNA